MTVAGGATPEKTLLTGEALEQQLRAVATGAITTSTRSIA